jgi:hypothetical protein
MPSPFPGMNPYLEQSSVWIDFHDSFIPALRDAFATQLGSKYKVRIQEHLLIRRAQEAVGRADLGVSSPRGTSGTAGPSASTIAAPLEVTDPILSVDAERIPYLEITTRDGQRLVTVIELLSPANKYRGKERRKFLKKRLVLLNRAAHYLEIDLLRGGPRMPVPDLPACDYCIYLSRYDRRPTAEVWPLTLRDPLPEVPIPLLPGDPDARADLQAVLHGVYDRANYAASIYDTPPEPALSKDDAAWATQFVPVSLG